MNVWLPIEYVSSHTPVHIDTVTKAAFIDGYIPTLENKIYLWMN